MTEDGPMSLSLKESDEGKGEKIGRTRGHEDMEGTGAVVDETEDSEGIGEGGKEQVSLAGEVENDENKGSATEGNKSKKRTKNVVERSKKRIRQSLKKNIKMYHQCHQHHRTVVIQASMSLAVGRGNLPIYLVKW